MTTLALVSEALEGDSLRELKKLWPELAPKLTLVTGREEEGVVGREEEGVVGTETEPRLGEEGVERGEVMGERVVGVTGS